MPEERKLVTVLFADVAGSTALGEELDPEDVRALMGRYYEHARRVVTDHGGTLEKFIGDAVMAVFGLPHAHGDDAERAVAAALALISAVGDDRELEDVSLRIGINTGEVVATSNPAAGDFLVTGDAVNVAARLQQCAGSGEILASERTFAATGAAFVYAEGRQVEVKGKRDPLKVFPVTGTREIRQSARPPMVGRDDDLMMLSLLHRRTLKEHRPQLVSLVAPAGTGKTRLLEEFLDGLDRSRVRVAVSRCPPYGQTLTYWPLRGLLEDLLGGVDRGRIVDAFAVGGNAPADAEHLADRILNSLGVEGDAPAEPESIYLAWRLLVEALAQKQPLIVVFEDLHWASESLLELVEHVMNPHTGASLLLVAISRPELLDRRPAWGGGGRQNFTALVLQPLDDEQTAELVGQLGHTLPASLQRQIAERSGGNPFFVTELVRGMVERVSDRTNQPHDLVPDTVHAAVLARLDLLEPEARRVLQAAAVGGRLIRPAIVQAVLDDLSSYSLQGAIDALLARDLIVPDEGGAFAFRHILVRDVAYGTLSRVERIRMHAAVARWLEDFTAERPDEYAELIAYHYREAVVLSRQSRTALPLPFEPEVAVRFLERAGQIAGRSGAMTEAREHLQSALSLAPAEEQGRLQEKLGDCCTWIDAGLRAYEEALQHWRSTGAHNPLDGARLIRKLLMTRIRWNPLARFTQVPEMRDLLVEAEYLVREAGDEDEMWRVRLTGAFLFLGLYDPNAPWQKLADYREMALAAADHFEKKSDWESFSEALDAYMSASGYMGMSDAVLAAGRRRLAVPNLTTTERADALQMMAWEYNSLAEYDQCIDFCDDVLDHRRPGESLLPASGTLGAACLAAYYTGRWDDLERYLPLVEEARTEFGDDSGFTQGLPSYNAALHLALAREDRPAAESAAATLQRLDPDPNGIIALMMPALLADDPRRVSGKHTPQPIPPAYIAPLLFYVERGIVPPVDQLTEAAALIQPTRVDTLVFAVGSAVALKTGDVEKVAAAVEKAERHGLVVHAARMRIVLAQMSGDGAYLVRARPVLERLKDRQFLRRLEEVEKSISLRAAGSTSRSPSE